MKVTFSHRQKYNHYELILDALYSDLEKFDHVDEGVNNLSLVLNECRLRLQQNTLLSCLLNLSNVYRYSERV